MTEIIDVSQGFDSAKSKIIKNLASGADFTLEWKVKPGPIAFKSFFDTFPVEVVFSQESSETDNADGTVSLGSMLKWHLTQFTGASLSGGIGGALVATLGAFIFAQPTVGLPLEGLGYGMTVFGGLYVIRANVAVFKVKAYTHKQSQCYRVWFNCTKVHNLYTVLTAPVGEFVR